MSIYEDDIPLLPHQLLPFLPHHKHATNNTTTPPPWRSRFSFGRSSIPSGEVTKEKEQTLQKSSRCTRSRFGLSKTYGNLEQVCRALGERSARPCTIVACKPGKTDFISCSVRSGPPRQCDIEGAKIRSASTDRISYEMKKGRALVVHLY